MANDNCDICNNISEPILNPALDPSNCFITTDRICSGGAGLLNITGNISTNFYGSHSELVADIQTNLMIKRLNNTTTRPLCEQARRPIFSSHKERLRYIKYYRERGVTSYLLNGDPASNFFESVTNS